MPICKKCDAAFPVRVLINGKYKDLRRRSYCLSCSPWGEKNGYALRKQKTRNIENTKDCVICNKTFNWTKNDVCSSCRTCYLRYCQKKKAVESLGGKCEKCGEDDFWLLTFHHSDPDEKSFNLASMWGQIEWNSMVSEIEKCVLLCLNCHRLEHLDKDKIFKVIDYYMDKS